MSRVNDSELAFGTVEVDISPDVSFAVLLDIHFEIWELQGQTLVCCIHLDEWDSRLGLQHT